MKRIIVPIICLLSILVVLINIDKITDKIIVLLNHQTSYNLTANNDYYKDNNYNYVQNVNNFTPYGKQDLLNIVYTVINNHQTNFTFYCPNAYTKCIDDVNTLSTDANILTHLNNFVHPFNSFTNINTMISDTGEIRLAINYLYTEEQIQAIDSEVNNIIEKLETPDLETDYDKIKVIHDYIINNTKYDLDENKDNLSYSAYGALFNHLATCNGYTDLMAIFLTKMGYDNFKIATTSDKDNAGHVWNAVNVDKEWVHLDLTWDDPVSSDDKDRLFHKYFLITTSELITADSNITSQEHNFDYNIYSELKEVTE